jgi:hypothetical protein
MKNQVSVYKTLTLNTPSVTELSCVCYSELFFYKKFSPLDLTKINSLRLLLILAVGMRDIVLPDILKPLVSLLTVPKN